MTFANARELREPTAMPKELRRIVAKYTEPGEIRDILEHAADELERLQGSRNANFIERQAGVGAAQALLPQTLTGEIACILEDCGPPEFQSPEALAELIRHYQPTWSRIVSALSLTDGQKPYDVRFHENQIDQYEASHSSTDRGEGGK